MCGIYGIYSEVCSKGNDMYIVHICCISCIIVMPAVVVDIVITIECQFRLNLGLFRGS